ncbi:MAG: helix-turn-helix domain-containing protein [Xanthomonadales bacterium]|nr:helix-turn-helix domain-containing protein [Xanthomonadales bacterium]
MISAQRDTVPMSIGSLSEATGCSRETIRYYEKQALLPQAQRSLGGHRQYTGHHLRMLRFILRARELGFGQDDVRRLLEMASPDQTDCGRVHDLASHQLADVRERLRDLRKLEKTLSELVRSCEKEGKAASCPVIESLLRA